MTAVAPGPYVHAGPYATGEFFDTTGTPPNFCPECEHAPCVGGGRKFCTMRPRFIVGNAVDREVGALLDQQFHNPLYAVLRQAVTSITRTAQMGGRIGDLDNWLAGHISDEALEDLAGIRAKLKRLIP